MLAKHGKPIWKCQNLAGSSLKLALGTLELCPKRKFQYAKCVLCKVGVEFQVFHLNRLSMASDFVESKVKSIVSRDSETNRDH
jgi:hypothetical protein